MIGDVIDIDGFSIGDSRSVTISFAAGCQLTPEHKTSAYYDYKLVCWPREVMSHFSRAECSVLFNPVHPPGLNMKKTSASKATSWTGLQGGVMPHER
jgi:hypothetical protein